MFRPVTSAYRSTVPVFMTALLLALTFAGSPLVLSPTAPRARPYANLQLLAQAPQGIGEPVPHVECEPGYTNSLYARGLWSPDGLAFDPDGRLYVVEEEADRVSRIEPDGSVATVLRDLDSPEGIAFDEAGNLYVVEDTPSGRLIRMTPEGKVTTLADGLAAPEGIAAVPGSAGAAYPTLYVTESNVQFVDSPLDLETRITALVPSDETTHEWSARPLITHTPFIGRSQIAFWSYAGIAWGPDGMLYVTNELAGQKITRHIEIILDFFTIQATLATNDSIFAIDPNTGARTLVAKGLLSPEGLSFSATGDFPLYVAEEGKRYDARLSQVGRDGERTTVCKSLRGIEDVIVDPQGNLYVSEDRSGYIIQIRPTRPLPAGTTSGDEATLDVPSYAGRPDALVREGKLSRLVAGFLRGAWNQIIRLVRGAARLAQGLDSGSGSSRTSNRGAAKRLKLWDRAVVRNTAGEGLHCRDAAGLDAHIVDTLAEGTKVTLIRGPILRDEYMWWEVDAPDRERCWAAENWLHPWR